MFLILSRFMFHELIISYIFILATKFYVIWFKQRKSGSSIRTNCITYLFLPRLAFSADYLHGLTNLTRVTSTPNPTTDGSRLIFSVPFSCFIFIFYLTRCILLNFPSVSSLASLPFLPCCHRTTTTGVLLYITIYI